MNRAAWRDPVEREKRWPRKSLTKDVTDSASADGNDEPSSMFDRLPVDVFEPGLYNSHASRARRHGGVASLTPSQEVEVRRVFAGACIYCNDKASTVLEHVIPLARGGDHALWNVVASCPDCNASKGSKDLEAWCADTGRPFALIEARIAAGHGALRKRFGAKAMSPEFQG